ncbi:MAG: hypothetical protein JSV43_00535 [Methanobacteriota archaeon]|nr:MAG: hypothetical protein JSV43_00535 [Euryarchaeota archaeon]
MPPLRARIVDFPEDLPFSKTEADAFKKVHGLLSKIISPSAETYAKQLSLKRRRPHTMGLLWIMGLYGKSKKERAELVLDSKSQGVRAEYGWLVRKRDNTLYQTIAQCFGILKGHGVRGEFLPSKKDWKIRLTFNKKAGGKATLKALKNYAKKLVDKHGEPTYKGSSRFKGKAYSLFAKADMRILRER